MDKKRYSVQDALAVIQGDNSESSSDEDLEDYTPSNEDMENDESSESSDLDEVPQPKMNPGQQNTTTQGTKLFSWVLIQRRECHTPRQSSYSPTVFQEVHHSGNA